MPICVSLRERGGRHVDVGAVSKRLLRNYHGVVAPPSRTMRTVFVGTPSHGNFAPVSKCGSALTGRLIGDKLPPETIGEST